MIGFDPSRLPLIRNAWQDPVLGYDPQWSLVSDYWTDRDSMRRDHLAFAPPRGWTEHLRGGKNAGSPQARVDPGEGGEEACASP